MLLSSLFGRLVCLIVTLSSLPTAIVGGASGVYETVGPVYQTYRIAIQTWGKGQEKILFGLKGGSHPSSGANILEDLNDPGPHIVVNYVNNRATRDEKKSFFKSLPLPKIIAGSTTIFSEFLGKITTIVDFDEDVTIKKLGAVTTRDIVAFAANFGKTDEYVDFERGTLQSHGPARKLADEGAGTFEWQMLNSYK
ncbi:hypothetical protein V501_02897 [Pseudogymnoascus sp. VKM F-4519 (FW-2642)]|nr:hypothetical protein V501_02897 [Pseudogymnoascus sp. VKM F-4519 (FW-2642)]